MAPLRLPPNPFDRWARSESGLHLPSRLVPRAAKRLHHIEKFGQCQCCCDAFTGCGDWTCKQIPCQPFCKLGADTNGYVGWLGVTGWGSGFCDDNETTTCADVLERSFSSLDQCSGSGTACSWSDAFSQDPKQCFKESQDYTYPDTNYWQTWLGYYSGNLLEQECDQGFRYKFQAFLVKFLYARLGSGWATFAVDVAGWESDPWSFTGNVSFDAFTCYPQKTTYPKTCDGSGGDTKYRSDVLAAFFGSGISLNPAPDIVTFPQWGSCDYSGTTATMLIEEIDCP